MIRLVAHYEERVDTFGRKWRREWRSPRKRGEKNLKRFERWQKRTKFALVSGPVNQATNSIGSPATTNTTIVAPAAGNALILTSGASSLGNTLQTVTGGGVTWAAAVSNPQNAGLAEIWYGVNSSGAGTTITTTSGGAPYIINISEWSGIARTSTLQSQNSNGTTGTNVIATPALTIGAGLVVAAFGGATGGLTSGPTGGFTELTDADQTGALSAYLITSNPSASRSTSWTIVNTPGTAVATAIAAFNPQATIEQSKYRFRNDDGTERTATYAANENTTMTAGKNTNRRLRVQLNATNDPSSQSYQVEYRKQGSTAWHKVGE